MPSFALVRHSLAFTALIALALGSTVASAQNAFYTTGTYTIDAAHSVVNSAYVGEDSSFNRNDSMGHPYNPTVNLVTGGSVGEDITALNSSTVTISGGSVGGILYAGNSSTFIISGGSVDSALEALNSSTVTVSGGTFGQSSGVNFVDSTTGSFTLVGSNLKATSVGTDPTFGGTDYALSGTLQSGTDLSGYVLDVNNGSTFTLQPAAVPEPGSLALLAGMTLTGSVWVRRRRKNARNAV